MASMKVLLKSAQDSLDIRLRRRDGRPEIGTPAQVDAEGNETAPASEDYKPATPGLQAELNAAEAAFARVQDRLNKARAAVEKNETDIVKFQKVVSALSALNDADPETGDDTTDGADESVDEVPADTQGISEEITTEVPAETENTDPVDEAPAPKTTRGRGRAGRGSISE